MKTYKMALENLIITFTIALLLSLTACGREHEIKIGKAVIRCEQSIPVNDISAKINTSGCYSFTE
jgi:hypothetical protein